MEGSAHVEPGEVPAGPGGAARARPAAGRVGRRRAGLGPGRRFRRGRLRQLPDRLERRAGEPGRRSSRRCLRSVPGPRPADPGGYRGVEAGRGGGDSSLPAGQATRNPAGTAHRYPGHAHARRPRGLYRSCRRPAARRDRDEPRARRVRRRGRGARGTRHDGRADPAWGRRQRRPGDHLRGRGCRGLRIDARGPHGERLLGVGDPGPRARRCRLGRARVGGLALRGLPRPQLVGAVFSGLRSPDAGTAEAGLQQLVPRRMLRLGRARGHDGQRPVVAGAR